MAATKDAHALEKDDVYFQGDVGQTASRTDWPDMLIVFAPSLVRSAAPDSSPSPRNGWFTLLPAPLNNGHAC